MAWDNIRYSNSGAVRNQPITDELAERLSEAVTAVYGPGAYAQVYSGGQPAKGSGGKRVGSTRHDNGMAADIHFYDANGNQITGDADLGRVGQYWLAKGYGSAGMEMHGGGVHLDQHTDRATHWNYADEGGRYTDAERAAIAAGLQGQLPPLYGQPPGATPAPAPGAPAPAPAPGAPAPAPAPGGAINNQQGGSSMTMDAEYARQQALRAALNAGEMPSAGDQLNSMMPGAGNPAPGSAPGSDLMLRPSGPNVGAFDPHQGQTPPQMQPQMPTLVQPQQAGFMTNWLNNPLNMFGARLMAASDPSGTSGASQMGRTIIDTQAAMSAQNATQLQAQMERLKLNAQMDAMMKDQLQTMKRREISSKLRKAGHGADADYIDMGGDFGKLIGIGQQAQQTPSNIQEMQYLQDQGFSKDQAASMAFSGGVPAGGQIVKAVNGQSFIVTYDPNGNPTYKPYDAQQQQEQQGQLYGAKSAEAQGKTIGEAGAKAKIETAQQIQAQSQQLAMTSDTLNRFEAGEFDGATGPLSGRIGQFFNPDTAISNMQSVNQALQNLGITNLAPVSNYEIGLVKTMFADPNRTKDQNIAVLRELERTQKAKMAFLEEFNNRLATEPYEDVIKNPPKFDFQPKNVDVPSAPQSGPSGGTPDYVYDPSTGEFRKSGG